MSNCSEVWAKWQKILSLLFALCWEIFSWALQPWADKREKKKVIPLFETKHFMSSVRQRGLNTSQQNNVCFYDGFKYLLTHEDWTGGALAQSHAYIRVPSVRSALQPDSTLYQTSSVWKWEINIKTGSNCPGWQGQFKSRASAADNSLHLIFHLLHWQFNGRENMFPPISLSPTRNYDRCQTWCHIRDLCVSFCPVW